MTQHRPGAEILPVPAEDAWMQTGTGGFVCLTKPDPDAIRIEDIAHHLARICRFGGAVASPVQHYSVAQHSVLVSLFVPPELALLGLLHDAAEAYLGDKIAPLKELPIMQGYRDLERAWLLAIGERFGVGEQLADLPLGVKEADRRALATECRDLLADGPAHRRWNQTADPLPVSIQPLGAHLANDAFMARFTRLTG